VNQEYPAWSEKPLSWDVIEEIQKADLTKRFSKPSLKSLQRLAIDEIAVSKGHKYLTVVMDLDTGAVVLLATPGGMKPLNPSGKCFERAKQTLWQSQPIWAEHIFQKT